MMSCGNVRLDFKIKILNDSRKTAFFYSKK